MWRYARMYEHVCACKAQQLHEAECGCMNRPCACVQMCCARRYTCKAAGLDSCGGGQGCARRAARRPSARPPPRDKINQCYVIVCSCLVILLHHMLLGYIALSMVMQYKNKTCYYNLGTAAPNRARAAGPRTIITRPKPNALMPNALSQVPVQIMVLIIT